MKKPPIIKILAFGLFISVTLLPAGSLRAAERPKGSSNLESQARKTDNKLGYNQAKDWGQEPEEKRMRFALLEWLIREKLMQQYQKIDFPANPDMDY